MTLPMPTATIVELRQFFQFSMPECLKTTPSVCLTKRSVLKLKNTCCLANAAEGLQRVAFLAARAAPENCRRKPLRLISMGMRPEQKKTGVGKELGMTRTA